MPTPALPPGFTLDQPSSVPAPPPGFTLDKEPAAAPKSAVQSLVDWANGAGEAASNVVGSGLGAVFGGLAGIAGAALPGPQNQGTDWANAVGNEFAYQPRTKEGQAISDVVNFLPEALMKGADYAGGKATDITGSPAAGAAVKTGVAFLPSLLMKGRVAAPAAALPETVARNFIRTRTGLDWNTLADATKQKLTEIAKDSETLGQLDPAALERQARLESLPVPIKATRGQITRDTADLTNEGTLASTETGRPLKAVRDAQSPAILANIELLKNRVGGTAETPQQVGLSVQDAALRAKLRGQQKVVSQLYDAAEKAGEMQGRVSTLPLRQLVQNAADPETYSWVRRSLDNLRDRQEQRAPQVDAASMPDRNSATLAELEEVRKDAVARAMNGGADGYYAGKVIRSIDDMTQGYGGQMYQKARAARKAQALEFEDQGAVARLVENKSRTDRATALEDTWSKTVLGGSIADLNAVKTSLLTGADAATRTAGRRAWRDMRGQTLQYIADQATKSAAPLPDGSPAVSAAGMQQALNAIGADKLESLFGPGTVRQINRIMQATKDVRTEPPRIHPGSSTFGNVMAFLEKGVGKIPLLGDVTTGTIRTVGKLKEIGRGAREIKEAQTSPLEDAAAQAQAQLRARSDYRYARRALPAVIPTQGGQSGR